MAGIVDINDLRRADPERCCKDQGRPRGTAPYPNSVSANSIHEIASSGIKVPFRLDRSRFEFSLHVQFDLFLD